MTTVKAGAKSETDVAAATAAAEDAVEAEEFDPENPLELRPRTDEEKAEVPRIVLFSIGDKKYTIPNETRPNLASGYLYKARTIGVGRAESWLAERMLGPEAYEALINFDDLTQEQSDEIFRRAREVIFGRRDPKAMAQASQRSGTRSSTAPRKKQSAKRKSTRG